MKECHSDVAFLGTVSGTTGPGGNLTLVSTTDATKGWVYIGDSVRINDSGIAIGEGSGDPTSAVPLKINANQVLLGRYSDAPQGSAQFVFQRARGTAAEPAAVQSGDTLFQLQCNAYGSTAMSSAGRASINMFSTENWTDAAQGTSMTFRVTPSGAAAEVQQMKLTDKLLELADGLNIQTTNTTGTKIGTSTGQKVGFHNATPTAQRAGAAQAAVATTSATNSSPYGFTTADQADAIITLLNEIRATLVEKGLMKGSA